MSIQPEQGQTVHVQTANAAESAVVIQVAGDLHISDPGQLDRWLAPQRPTAPGECPYPGLDAFGPGEARWFFGRDAAISDVLRYLDTMRQGGPGGPLLVVAPSGTGKSSLLRAGLWKALDEGRLPAPGSQSWPRIAITALGPRPTQALRSALATVTSTEGIPVDSRTIVVIDQLEEVFTVCESEEERAEFLSLVGTLLALGNAAGDVYLFAVPSVVKNNNLGGQTELGVFAASGKTIWSVQFLSNSTLIAGGTDGVARFWSVPSGKNWNDTIPVQEVATHAGLISAMSYSAPLGLLATGSPSGSRVWQTNPAQVATSICQSLKAPVRQALWTDYLPGIPYVPVC